MVKRKIIWSNRAKNDLLNILDFYYKRNGTKYYSIKLNESLRSTIRLLENNPELGVYADIKNIRNLIQGNFNVFYEIKEEFIEIITIWDNRQDPEKLNLIDNQ
jgi:toxin YoeB